MPSRAGYLAMPLAQRIERLRRTCGEFAAAIAGFDDGALSRRAPDGWSAKEIVCHMRDIEELCIIRYHTILVVDDLKVFVAGAPPKDAEAWGIREGVPFPLSPERWAEDRQYLRSDTAEALAAFRRRRGEVLTFLDALTPEQWQRTSIHPEHGRITIEDWTPGVAGHDDNHLEQLRRALDA